ncbi:hypothetical protein IWW54_004936 [Coemansia sp. RSA 2705]|nr:hypothetical protein IWW54_004936 [Coemansia sp. RSA 2705]
MDRHPGGPTVNRADFAHLQELSLRLKALREPARELARSVSAGTQPPSSSGGAQLRRLHEQLDTATRLLHEYLGSIPGVPADHPALRPKRLSQASTRSRSSTQGSQDSGVRVARPASLHVAGPALAAVPEAPAQAHAVERALLRMWTRFDTALATPVNEVSVRLGRRLVAPLEERVPQVPSRALQGDRADIVDLVGSLLRSSARANEPSLLVRRLETVPPGIVACAIANSAAQLFAQVTPAVVAQYAGGGQPAALRLLSDHANFLTRLMETSIVYPIHAAQRARRIEWWAVVASLLRELGDYESLSSLVCVFSGAAVDRLHASWDLVPEPCKQGIRYVLDSVLKIHPNYASYRDELRLRMRRCRRPPAERAAPEPDDELSLDFDCALAISTPDLCASDDGYATSAVFGKEPFELPPPRLLVPIVAVLLKDAVSAEAGKARSPESWSAVLESCRPVLPLPLDYFMLRRVFATELSALPLLASAQQSARLSTISFLKRMPRRHSDKDMPKELSMTPCRLAAQHAPDILDVLAHFLYLAAGNPCSACSMGALLESMHVATAAQMAVAVSSLLLFAEPWVPREYLERLCDLREPRSSVLQGSKTLQAAVSPPLPVSSHSQGYESRAADRPWLMSFKLNDSSDSARYFRTKSALPPPREDVRRDDTRKSSTDSDSTCINRPPSPPARSARLHRRSLSLHAQTGNPFAPSDHAVPDMPPLPTTTPSLPPPPLPAADMPTWLPSLAKSPTQPVPPTQPLPPVQPTRSMQSTPAQSQSPPRLTKTPPRSNQSQPRTTVAPPPPLPSQPMPRFQPAASPPVADMPPMFNILPDPGRMRQLDGISAETQMLLSFDSRSRRR